MYIFHPNKNAYFTYNQIGVAYMLIFDVFSKYEIMGIGSIFLN